MKYLVNKNFELFSVGSQRSDLLNQITSNAPLNDGKQVKISDVKEGSEYVKNSESMTDMLKALDAKLIGGIGLDVFNEEPYNGDLTKYENVILTPHIGSYAKEIRNKMEIESVNNLIKGFNAK